jgi:hypothetical protein
MKRKRKAMKVTLTQSQRILVAVIYLIVLIVLFSIIDGNFSKLSEDKNVWFISGALLIILGKYVAEPFFSKPTDAITNSAAIIITLLNINDKEKFIYYELILIVSLTVLFFSLVTILLKSYSNERLNKLNKFSYVVSTKIGNSNVLFSLIYIPAIYSYYLNIEIPDVKNFTVLFFFWFCLLSFDIVGKLVEFFSDLFKSSSIIEEELGQAIGCENPLLYKVEVDYLKHKETNIINGDIVTVETERLNKSIGIVINKKQLLNKLWLEIYLLTDENDSIIKLNQNHRLTYSSEKSILKSLNSVKKVSSIDYFPQQIRDKVSLNELYSNRENFVGYVEKGSNINQIIFQHIGQNRIKEGQIIVSNIYGDKVLFQIIDGQTREEPLEFKDGYGFEVAFARKLGSYNEEENELEIKNWLPNIYTPVFTLKDKVLNEEILNDIASNSIGRLPETTYRIPIKDYNALVTHNTAILGILGIGKSRLTFELIKKTLENIEGLKIICIDITNEYKQDEKLPRYISTDLIQADEPNIFNEINDKYDYIETIGDGNYAKQIPDKSGNIEEYRKALRADIINFLFNSDQVPEEYTPSNNKRIRIYNPDYHKVSKGEKMGIHVLTPSLSPAEKTRVISEEILKILMKFQPTDDSSSGRVFIVYEEAHSLIPEWNSVANDGDKTAVNGTAKIILQGRKYGLGSLVITQRTANISKSILNQCNTIFALRVFDDTGKQFLENYIGSDYSNTLPTLEERHTIAVGKALKLKQPIIIQLNDMKHIIQE